VCRRLVWGIGSARVRRGDHIAIPRTRRGGDPGPPSSIASEEVDLVQCPLMYCIANETESSNGARGDGET
jgi:hypothetical protein